MSRPPSGKTLRSEDMPGPGAVHVETTADAVIVEALTLDPLVLSADEADTLATRIRQAASEVRSRFRVEVPTDG